MIFRNLFVFGVVHGVVDLISAAVVFSFLLGGMDLGGFIRLAIIYNVFAFGTQAVFGHLVDVLKKPKEGAIISMFFLLVSLILIRVSPIGAVIMVGLGNALFHVCGGTVSLNLIPRRATAPGIYVSLGALGLFIGTLMGKSLSGIMILLVFLILISTVMILLVKIPKINYNKEKISTKFRYFELVVLLLLLVVVSRAFVGTMLIFSWNGNLVLATFLIISIVLGKALGGFFADKFGWIRVSVIALIISAPLLSFAAYNPFLAMVGAFLFNFSMPVTLTALSNTLPGRPGFAFGLTTLALLIGALPALVGYKELVSSSFLIFMVTLFSALILYLVLKSYYQRKV